MNLREGNLEFEFIGETESIKFDDESFYKKRFNRLPEGKGVDFISLDSNEIIFLEVKDCLGYESENRWRIAPNNQKVDTAAITPDGDRESLDIEIAKKVAMTLACLCGAHTKANTSENAEALKSFSEVICSDKIKSRNVDIKIILFLEGNFGSRTIPEKAVLQRLGKSIEKKLDWLQCKVLVENINTCSSKKYKVARV